MAYNFPSFQPRPPRSLASVMFPGNDYSQLPGNVMNRTRANYLGAMGQGTPPVAHPAPQVAPMQAQAYAPMAPASPPPAPMASAPPNVPPVANYQKDPSTGVQTMTQQPHQGHGNEVGARDAINQLLSNSLGHQGDLNTLIANLLYKSQVGNLDELAQAHAVEFGDLNRYYDQGQQRLEQALARRGMTGTGLTGALLGFEGQRAAGLGRERSQITAEDIQRQDQAQRQLQGILQFLEGQGASLADAKANRKMSKWQLRQQLKDRTGWGDILGSLIGTIGGLAGTAGQLGWKPFGKGSSEPDLSQDWRFGG